jgi:hypothetical protein
MLRNAVCAVVVLGLSFGISAAEDAKGKITKIDDKNVTLVVGKKADAKTNNYEITKDCKFFKMDKKNKVDLADGIKSDVFKDIDPKKGVAATLTIVDGKVTEVIIGGKKKKNAN